MRIVERRWLVSVWEECSVRGREGIVRHGLVGILVMLGVLLLAVGCSTATGADTAETTTSTSTTVPETSTTTVPPTTQTSPSTTVAVEEEEAAIGNELSAEQMGFVEAFVSGFNDGEIDSFLKLFDPNATAKTLLFSAYSSNVGNMDLFPQELAYRWAMNARWELEECKFEFGAIACGILVSRDDLTYNTEPLNARLRLTVDDGVITNLTLTEDATVIYATAIAFYDWLVENHPDSVDFMYWRSESVPRPKLTDESIALWVELVPLFNTSLNA